MSATLIAALPNLLLALDEQLGEDFSQPSRLLMLMDVDRQSIDFSLKELPPGMHPLEELLGFVAPDDCLAIGAVCHGWATRDVTKRPSRAPDRVRVRSLHAVCRDGSVVGGFHLAGKQLDLKPLAEGMVPDALRRTIGLATASPESPAAELSAADWLDAIAEDARVADIPPTPYPNWDEPRWEVVTGERVLRDLTPTAAAWMDAGIFARWMTPTYPRTADHLAAVRRVVDARTYKAIRATLEEWGVFS